MNISKIAIPAILTGIAFFSLNSCGLMAPPAGFEANIAVTDDVVSDLSRNLGTVTFETIVPVSLDLTIDVAAESAGSGGRILYAENPDAAIIATVVDEGDHVLYRGKADPQGHVAGQFHVPTSAASVALILEGAGLETRRVDIPRPASLESVVRTMTIVETTAGSAMRSAAFVPDRDADGVPDLYDVAPLNDTIAFATLVPAVDSLTVAFEDNFPRVGDGDYNDFVATLTLAEFRSGEDSVVAVGGVATARAKVSGYDHEFGLTLDIFARIADPELADQPYLLTGLLDSHGYLLEQSERSIDMTAPWNDDGARYRVRIPFFRSTRGAFGSDSPVGGGLYPEANPGHVAWFLIVLDDKGGYRIPDAAPYDPYLFIHNTGYDVHLVGRNSLEGTANPAGSDGFVDDQGFPRGLLLPVEWSPPNELNDIRVAYPRFSAWMADLKAGILGYENDWYLDPAVSEVFELPASPVVDLLGFLLDQYLSGI